MIPDLKTVGASPDFMVKKEWQVVRLWQIARIRSEKNRPDLPLLSVFLGRGVIAYGEGGGQVHKPGQDLSIYQVVREGDFVLNNQQAWRGSVGVSKHHGIISPAYVVLALSDALNPHFADYLFQSRMMIAQFVTSSKGVGDIQRDIHTPWLKNMKIPVPPLNEQATIVRFLDYANRRLERAIRAKRKVIALLNEQKQAIIHRAVTRGLDPNVQFKPSGSHWFPELPQEWEALTLRRVITAAIDGPHFSPNYQDSGIPFLSARNIKADRWSLSDAKYISESDYREFSKRVCPEVGDVLYTKGGTTGVARAVDLTFRFQVWVHIAVLKLNRERIDPEYLAFALNSPRCYEQSQLFTRGATNQDLGLGRMKEIELPVPPILDEQRQIVADLKMALASVDAIIARNEREMALLREYSTRLIADVVTGKLDVREAVKAIPDEADELEDYLENGAFEDEDEIEALPSDEEGTDE